MKLIGKDYFNIKNNKIYNVIICDTIEKRKQMIEYFLFYLKKYKNRNPIIGIDFEFNNINNMRKIALFQINLESDANESTIYMFYPPDLDEKQFIILKKFLSSKYIKKVIHGGESLDIPYLFNNIFITLDERKQFCENLIDTKYLCEYYNMEYNKPEYKCKIYELLLQMGIINDNHYQQLLKNEEMMGPIYEIIVNVNNMSEPLIKYCMFDVLYLPALIKSFPNNKYYNNILPELTTIHYILKQTDFFSIESQNIAFYNNLFLKYDNINIRLIEIYEYVYYWLKSNELDYLLEITYFKKFFQLILKSIVYHNITKNNIVYIDNNNINKKIMKDLTIYIVDIDSFKYTIEMIKDIKKKIDNLI